MTIIEAIKTMKDGQAITRKDEIGFGYYIPTDGPGCVEMYEEDGNLLNIKWNPRKDDLIADDWVIVKKITPRKKRYFHN